MSTSPGSTGKSTRLWLILGALVVVVVVAIVIGVRIYAAQQNANAEPTLSERTQETVAEETAESIDGSWTAADGSQAGYRVDEVLNGEDVTVVGRTEAVTGDLEISGSELGQAEIVIDLREVATDADRRDEYFKNQAIDTSSYPDATFTLSDPVDVSALAETTGQAEVTAQGTVSLNGTENDVELTLDVVREADRITVTGDIPTSWSDYGVEAPDLGFVSVEDEGTIEFSLVFERA